MARRGKKYHVCLPDNHEAKWFALASLAQQFQDECDGNISKVVVDNIEEATTLIKDHNKNLGKDNDIDSSTTNTSFNGVSLSDKDSKKQTNVCNEVEAGSTTLPAVVSVDATKKAASSKANKKICCTQHSNDGSTIASDDSDDDGIDENGPFF